MATRMQQRRGTAAQWTAANPTLAAGEIGFETDTSKFKIGNGSSAWTALTYFANAAELAAIIDSAPAALNTLNELAAAINDDANFYTNILTSIDNAVTGHNNASLNVHGIANTANLATTSDISTHNSDTTDVHGIADTAALATKSYADTAEADAITAAGTAADTKIATAVAALTKSSVGLANVDNTADSSKPVSTAQATAIATAKSEAIADATAQVNAVIASAPAALNTLDELAAALGDDANFATSVTTSLALKAPLASPTFTGTVTLPAAGIVFSDGTQALEGVPSRTPIIQKTASYTLSSLTERDDLIEMGSASAITLSIPTDATLNYPVGTSIDILQTGAGQVTIAAVTPGTTTVNATPGLKLRTTWSSCTLFKRAANTWVVYGDLTA